MQRLAIIKLNEKNGKDKRLIKNWRHISVLNVDYDTAQKMKFSIKDFFSKCGQIRSLLRIWSHLLKKPLMENFIFVQCKKTLQPLTERLKNILPLSKKDLFAKQVG